MLVTLGNFIYAVPSYAVVLLLGRLLQGIGHSLISVIQGEIIRNYEEEERVQKLSTFTISTYVCYIGSPIVITVFSGIDFEILGVRFAVYNLPFVFVGVLWALSILLTIFFVSDLSKEHHLQVGKTKDENPTNKELPLTILLSNYQFSFILLLTFVGGYFTVAFNGIRLPTISTELYNIPVNYIAMFFTLEGISFGITMFVSNKLKHGDCEIYFIVLGMCFILIALQAMTLSVVLYQFKTLGISLLVVFIIFVEAGWSAEQVFLVALLGKLVPSNTQGYAAGVRKTAANISYIFGALFSPVVRNYIPEHAITLSICILGICYVVLYNRKRFINVSDVHFHSVKN